MNASSGTNSPSPAISILLPVRNCVSTLGECLVSIQNQTLDNHELIVVDDHSSDASAAIVQSYAGNDPRIRLFNNPGRGLVAALNHGLGLASCRFVARMDGDDIMLPQRLQLQYEYMLQHPDITALGSFARLFPEHAIQDGFREYMRWQNSCITPRDIADEIYIESPLVHPSIMFRQDAVMELGGYRAGPFPEDYDLWLRMHHAGMQMTKLSQELLEWRDYPERTSRVDARCSREAFDRLRASYLAREPRLLQHQDNFVIWGAGRKTRKRCRHLLNHGLTPRAWVDIDPNKIGNRLNGVPVVAPQWLQLEEKPFVLGYVANHGARDDIASQLHAMGYQRGSNYLMVG
jgi:glycosyltransferase involved in cell wall biosynthesis